MQGYDRDEVEDYDEYEDYGEEQDEEGEEEEEDDGYEEEERKPSAEELEYLQLRERIKEQIRKKRQKQSDSSHSRSQDKKNKLPFNNHGSFFGTSQQFIAPRVIQESKSFLENQHLAFRVSNSHDATKKNSSTVPQPQAGLSQQLPKVKNKLQVKVQRLRDTRDYSFLLSDDAEPPAPTKEPAPRNVFAQSSDARSASVLHKSKEPSGINGRNIQGTGEDRKSHPTKGKIDSKTASYKSTSVSKPKVDSRRQIFSQNGIGLGQPVPPKGLPLKTHVATMEKKASAPVAKNIPPTMYKPSSSNVQSSVSKQHMAQKRGLQEPIKAQMLPKQAVAPSKPQSSVSKQHTEHKRGLQEPIKAKMMPKQALASSKLQVNKPVKNMSSRAPSQHNHLKKKSVRQFSDDEDEDEKALSMIRRMFNTQRFTGREDDDSDMEANFDDIMKEERRSAKIARKEDEEQLRLIEEEEQRERTRKLAKKRKLSH